MPHLHIMGPALRLDSGCGFVTFTVLTRFPVFPSSLTRVHTTASISGRGGTSGSGIYTAFIPWIFLTKNYHY